VEFIGYKHELVGLPSNPTIPFLVSVKERFLTEKPESCHMSLHTSIKTELLSKNPPMDFTYFLFCNLVAGHHL
jgi:hypothetical protein